MSTTPCALPGVPQKRPVKHSELLQFEHDAAVPLLSAIAWVPAAIQATHAEVVRLAGQTGAEGTPSLQSSDDRGRGGGP